DKAAASTYLFVAQALLRIVHNRCPRQYRTAVFLEGFAPQFNQSFTNERVFQTVSAVEIPGVTCATRAAALGFISAIGAVGGFFIPQAFGMSLNMTGSPVGAMKVFLIFYIVCVLLTWLVYGRRKFSQK
ncbi:hypothetical protein ACSLPB_26040, partial [Escherichia coli]